MNAHVAAYYAYRAAVCEAHGLWAAARYYARRVA